MSKNNRRETRQNDHDRVHVQLLRDDSSEQTLVFHTETENVSASGLCVRINQLMSNGSIMDVLLEHPGQASPFLLTIEVRWCHRVRAGVNEFDVGFHILPAAHSDYDDWQAMFLAT